VVGFECGGGVWEGCEVGWSVGWSGEDGAVWWPDSGGAVSVE
jgi:hypothetical protein